MSAFNATALIVDDRDPSVVYSPGWQQSDTTAEFDDTKSGADEVGMTASFKFTGMCHLTMSSTYIALNESHNRHGYRGLRLHGLLGRVRSSCVRLYHRRR